MELPSLDVYLEPIAVKVARSDPRIALSVISAFSMAVSMKRLADHLAGDLNRTGIVDAMYDIGKKT